MLIMIMADRNAFLPIHTTILVYTGIETQVIGVRNSISEKNKNRHSRKAYIVLTRLPFCMQSRRCVFSVAT